LWWTPPNASALTPWLLTLRLLSSRRSNLRTVCEREQIGLHALLWCFYFSSSLLSYALIHLFTL
jgi:hypothetical protein